MNIINIFLNNIEKVLGIFKIILYKIIFNKSLILKGFPRIRLNTKIKIENNGVIIANNYSCFDNCLIIANGGRLEVGAKVFFNRNCIFGPGVMIYDHDHKFNENEIFKNKYKLGIITIEKNCWIGAGCIILRNTHIGEGCVIGAGCIVKGHIPPHSLVTSNRKLNIVPINK